MNEGAASVILGRFLKGSFDILDALLSLSFSFKEVGVASLESGSLAELLPEYSVSFHGKVKESGALAMLLTTENATQLVSLTLSGTAESKPELTDDDISTLNEVADAFMGGGLSSLAELFGAAVEQFESMEVDPATDTATLEALLSASVTVGEFTFSAGDTITGKGYLLFDDLFESRVPESALAESDEGAADEGAAELAQGAEVSDEEMNEILSGFEPGAGEMEGGGAAAPENLELILDIRLNVTVRLGKVEMPIGDVLNLGPGSIVEVGHLIDAPVELLVNEKLIARGDVVVVDEKFGLRITEIVSPIERVESLR